MRHRYTKEDKKKFLELYKRLGCNISKTCKAFQINRSTFQRWVKKDKVFQARVEEANEAMFDKLENAMYKKAIGFTRIVTKSSVKIGPKGTETTTTNTKMYFPPDVSAAKLLLDAKARHRGYGMKPDDSDADQHPDDE